MDNPPIDWLLEGDPVVVWQAQRNLLDESAEVYRATQARLVTTDWATRFLARQDPDGTWTCASCAGGRLQPKGLPYSSR